MSNEVNGRIPLIFACKTIISNLTIIGQSLQMENKTFKISNYSGLIAKKNSDTGASIETIHFNMSKSNVQQLPKKKRIICSTVCN